MLRVPEHQVAGHKAGPGKLGPLIDDSGRFYKPLQAKGRGEKEVSFYILLFSNAKIPDHIRKFFPLYHGTQLIEPSDGFGMTPYLVLQDVVSGRLNPSIMDIKIGARTWYPEASEDYNQKCFKRDRESTSPSLGFRISGFQKYEDNELGFWKPSKKVVMGFTTDDVWLTLRKFVSSHSSTDCSFARSVYGGILAQLLELKAWFEDQTLYHFHSCSVLIVYEKEFLLKGLGSGAEVKLIDFAHFTEGNGVINHNFLGGLCSLIKFFSEILTSSDQDSCPKACCLLI